jgi:hypothetical protein
MVGVSVREELGEVAVEAVGRDAGAGPRVCIEIVVGAQESQPSTVPPRGLFDGSVA